MAVLTAAMLLVGTPASAADPQPIAPPATHPAPPAPPVASPATHPAAPAPPAAAPPANQPKPDERVACVSEHETSQLDRRDGKLRAARAALLTCSRPVCPAAIRADCGDWLTEVERSLPTVVIAARSPRGDESSGRVLLDGAVFAKQLDGQPLDVDPGPHVFRFEIPPYAPVEQNIVIRTGEKNREILVTLGSTPSTTPPVPIEEYRPVPTAAWVLGGGTVAGLALFAGLGGSGLAMRSSLDTSCAPFCTDAQVQPVRTRFLAADISLGTAAVAAIAAIVVYVRRPAQPVRHAPSTTALLTGVFTMGPQAAPYPGLLRSPWGEP